MTNGQQEQPPEPHGVGEPADRQQPEPHGGGTDWKAEARKWEQRAKENGSAAAERGVSAAVLERMAGDGEWEIRANAEVLLASAPAPAYPTAPQGGAPRPPAVTREQVMGIANGRERLRAIADNIDLF